MKGTYEITVQVANGDWEYFRQPCKDFHQACETGIAFATVKDARLIRVERVGE